MASYREGYEGQKHHGNDEYGNPIRQTDEFGNPNQHTTGGSEYGSGGLTGAGATGTQKHHGNDEYGNSVRQTDEYGNPIKNTTGGSEYGSGGLTGAGATGTQKHHGNDEYGNPVHQTDEYKNPTTGGSEYGSGGLTGSGATGMHGTDATTGVHGVGLSTGTYGEPQKLQRSGSPNSGSLEDDGMGGRRKKGIKEKITEKLPGGHKQEQQTHNTTATPVNGGSYGTTGEYGATATGEQPFEKKGIMDKIKDKLPGAHH